MEREYSNCVASQQRKDLNITSREDRPRILVYFEEPQNRDHDIIVPVEPDWL
jgi:hypothetical protein